MKVLGSTVQEYEEDSRAEIAAKTVEPFMLFSIISKEAP